MKKYKCDDVQDEEEKRKAEQLTSVSESMRVWQMERKRDEAVRDGEIVLIIIVNEW